MNVTPRPAPPLSPSSSPLPLYMDYAATTPLDPAVLQAMLGCLQDGDEGEAVWANAASAHAPGLRASAAVEQARAQVAALVNAEPGEIIFTSGATEANNLAIKGAVEFNRSGDRPVHVVTARTEHRCVVDTCRWLETRGVAVSWLVPGADGRVAPQQVLAVLRPETLLVSLMWVNNETGARNDIPRLATQLRERGVMLHVDAVQAVGKLPIDLRRVPVDLLSLSAHKIYGPKGIGALFVRRRPRARVAPQMHGGGHEQGMRSGTLANHQIVGMGRACALAAQRLASDAPRLAELRERLWRSISADLPQVLRNTPAAEEACAPHILNLSFEGVDGEALRASLPFLAVSSGSACSSATAEPSYVLRALGRGDALADASLRFSIGRASTQRQVDRVATAVVEAVQRVRALSPRGQASNTGMVPVGVRSAEPRPPANPFAYPAGIWRRFWHAGHAGSLAPGPGVHCAEAQAVAARAVLELSAGVEQGRVQQMRFRALGDPFVIAVGEYLAAHGSGLALVELSALRAADICAALDIPEDRLHCALLGEDALTALIETFQGAQTHESATD